VTAWTSGLACSMAGCAGGAFFAGPVVAQVYMGVDCGGVPAEVLG